MYQMFWKGNPSSISLSADGHFGVLAEKTGLFVLDLESDTKESCRALFNFRPSQENVNIVECNPHISHGNFTASSSQDLLYIWNFDSSSHPLIADVKPFAHSEPLHDIKWSQFQPHLLATCSADPRIVMFDIRTTSKPVSTLQPGKGKGNASRLSWNPLVPYTLVSTHGGHVCLWDIRRGNLPIGGINAHRPPVAELDWSPRNSNLLVTCTNPGFHVKLWNINRPQEPAFRLQLRTPVKKVCFAPFGHALVTVSAEYTPRRNVRIWHVGSEFDGEGHDQAQASQETSKDVRFAGSLVGHTASIDHLAVRRIRGLKDQGTEQSVENFQILTLSQDGSMTFFDMDEKLLRACDYKRTARNEDSLDTAGNLESSNLVREIRSVAQKLPEVFIEKMELKERFCDFSLPFILLRVTFPLVYPQGDAPQFTIFPKSAYEVSQAHESAIVNTLIELAMPLVEQALPCLEECLSYLTNNLASILSTPLSQLEDRSSDQQDATNPAAHSSDDSRPGFPSSLSSSSPDSHPTKDKEGNDKRKRHLLQRMRRDTKCICPRLCGATFGPSGRLVYFNNFPALMHHLDARERRLRMKRRKKKDSSGIDGESRLTEPSLSDSQKQLFEDQGSSFPRNVADLRLLPDLADILTDDLVRGPRSSDSESSASDASETDSISSGSLVDQDSTESSSAFLDSEEESFDEEEDEDEDEDLEEDLDSDLDRQRFDLASKQLSSESFGAMMDNQMYMTLNASSTLHALAQQLDDVEEEAQMNQLENTSEEQDLGIADPTEDFFRTFYGSRREQPHDDGFNSSSSSIAQALTLSSGHTGGTNDPGTTSDVDSIHVHMNQRTKTRRDVFDQQSMGFQASHPSHNQRGVGGHNELTSNSRWQLYTLSTSIMIADFSMLQPVNLDLAYEYKLSGAHSSAVCLANMKAAQNVGRRDLARTWHLASLITKRELTSLNNPLSPWSENPLGGRLARKLIDAYTKRGDIQTAALMSCVFSFPSNEGGIFRNRSENSTYSPFPPANSSRDDNLTRSMRSRSDPSTRSRHTSPSMSPFSTSRTLQLTLKSTPPSTPLRLPSSHDENHLHSVASLSKNVVPRGRRQNRMQLPQQTQSNQDRPSNPTGTTIFSDKTNLLDSPLQSVNDNNSGLWASGQELTELSLDEIISDISQQKLQDAVVEVSKDDLGRLQYSEYVYRVGAMQQRVEVLKFVQIHPALSYDLTGYRLRDYQMALGAVCPNCSTFQRLKIEGKDLQGGPSCEQCGSFALRCCICDLSVKGLATICPDCLHGGHPLHMQRWFESNSLCPAGCGCSCQSFTGLKI